MNETPLPPMEQQVLEEVIASQEADPELVGQLLQLVMHDYADLRVWGNKAALEREIAERLKIAAARDAAAQ